MRNSNNEIPYPLMQVLFWCQMNKYMNYDKYNKREIVNHFIFIGI